MEGDLLDSQDQNARYCATTYLIEAGVRKLTCKTTTTTKKRFMLNKTTGSGKGFHLQQGGLCGV